MENVEWMKMVEEKYDEAVEKLEEAVEIARGKSWGTVDVLMDQEGLLYIDEEASINTMAGEVLQGEAIYIARLDAANIDEDTEVDVENLVEVKLDELNF
jgi:hypothetical protein